MKFKLILHLLIDVLFCLPLRSKINWVPSLLASYRQSWISYFGFLGTFLFFFWLALCGRHLFGLRVVNGGLGWSLVEREQLPAWNYSSQPYQHLSLFRILSRCLPFKLFPRVGVVKRWVLLINIKGWKRAQNLRSRNLLTFYETQCRSLL